MADLGPRDRLDVPIWNAIEANNFKQALKLVDKRVAKKPSEYLDVSAIVIVFEQRCAISLSRDIACTSRVL